MRHKWTVAVGVAICWPLPHAADHADESDARKLFTRVCGKAWDKGYASADGSYDSTAVRRLARQTVREMVRSGEIHVRQT